MTLIDVAVAIEELEGILHKQGHPYKREYLQGMRMLLAALKEKPPALPTAQEKCT